MVTTPWQQLAIKTGGIVGVLWLFRKEGLSPALTWIGVALIATL
jgi:hypothetical protein